MSNYRDFTKKNTKFTGVESITLPKGTSGERNGSPVVGEVRYNTDLGFLEQYNSTGWAGIDAPPTVTNISGTINEDTDSTITITGSNFKSGSTISIEGAGVSGVARPLATTFVNSGELTAATNASSVNYVGGASFDVKVTNPSGLSAVLTPAGTIDRDPTFTTGAGSLGTITDRPDVGIQGYSYNDGGTDYIALAFLTPKSYTWQAPFSGTVDVLVVGGGGGGGGSANSTWHGGGGGGAGGYIYQTGVSVTSGTNYGITVGAGGLPGIGQVNSAPNGSNGGNSVALGYTADGGGGGKGALGGGPANSGGSGGGGSPGGTQDGGSATGNGTGNAGGNRGATSGAGGSPYGSGGGGAGSAGDPNYASGATQPITGLGSAGGGNGGLGLSNSITGTAVVYAQGGAGGGADDNSNWGRGGIGGRSTATVSGNGGGYDFTGPNQNMIDGYNGFNNTGDGGGGGYGGTPQGQGGHGGDGIVVIRWQKSQYAGPTRFTINASDPDGDAISWSIASGSLPAGLSLNSSGQIVGYPNAVGSSSTSNFTVRVTSSGGAVDRAFSITVTPSADGSASTRAASSCLAIKNLTGTSKDGTYWITDPVTGGNPARECYCDMNTDGGGWTLVWKWEDPAGHGQSTYYGAGYNQNFWDQYTGNGVARYRGYGRGSMPGKTSIGATYQMIEATYERQRAYAYRGTLNSNLGTNVNGFYLNSATNITDTCTSNGGIKPSYATNSEAQVSGSYYGWDKVTPDNFTANCDGGWQSDCRWENCNPSVNGSTNHLQQTLHIWVK